MKAKKEQLSVPSNPGKLADHVLLLWAGDTCDVGSFLPLLVDLEVFVWFPDYEGVTPEYDGPEIQGLPGGKIIGFTSNKDVFSFGVQVQQKLQDGSEAFRTYLLINPDQSMNVGSPRFEGEGCLEPEEQEFLAQGPFVNPERSGQMLSDRYLLSKIALLRLTEEAKVVRSMAEALGPRVSTSSYTERTRQPSVSKRVKTLEVDVLTACSFPDLHKEVLPQDLWAMYNDLTYVKIPKIRYYTRLVEYAFFLYLETGEIPEGWSREEGRYGIDYSFRDSFEFSDSPVLIKARKYEKAIKVRPSFALAHR